MYLFSLKKSVNLQVLHFIFNSTFCMWSHQTISYQPLKKKVCLPVNKRMSCVTLCSTSNSDRVSMYSDSCPAIHPQSTCPYLHNATSENHIHNGLNGSIEANSKIMFTSLWASAQ